MTRWATVAALLASMGCSAESAFTSAEDAAGGYTGTATGGGGGGGGGTGTGGTVTAPETEGDDLALRPAQTANHVFIANPGRDTLTRVDVRTHEVRTAEVGHVPHTVLTSADDAHAVVFNSGDDTVSIVDVDALTTRSIDIRPNMNRMQLSPDGAWAVLWNDPLAPDTDGDDGAAVSFNEASFVHVPTGAHTGLAIGRDVRHVAFLPDSSLVVFATDTAIVMVDLTADLLLPELIGIADDVDPQQVEDFALAPGGTFAFVRQRFGTELLVVDLIGRAVDRVPVGDDPTDLDLSPDGTLAVVVCRGDAQLWLFDVDDPSEPVDHLDLFPDVALGALQFDPTGRRAVVYSTIEGARARFATWDLATDAIELHALVKGAETVSIAPDGETMLVFHRKADPSPDVDPDGPFVDAWALTLVAFADTRSNPMTLPKKPTGYAHESTGRRGYFVMNKASFLEVLDYRSLLYEEVALPSNPVFVGVLPDLDEADGDAPPAWVSQEHELGRLSFWDPDDAGLETVTGFELNDGIETE